MKEQNKNLAENLGSFLLELSEDVVKGLEEYLQVKNSLLLETV